MPTAYRETILAQLKTTLLTIAGAGTWAQTTVPLVLRVKHPAMTLPQMPCALFAVVSESYEPGAAGGSVGVYDRTMDVGVDYWIESDNMDTELSKVVHDVEKAIGTDLTLNATCNYAHIVDAQPFIGDVDNQCGVRFTVRVFYRTDWNAPATRV